MKDDIIVSEKMASTAMAMRLPSFVGTFFAGVPNGSFEIRESRLRLSGDAGEWSERDALIMDVKNTLEYSVEIDDFLVANAPEGLWESLSLSVTKDGVDVTLEGKLPSGKLKSQLTASVALAFPRARVVDNVEVLSEGGWVSFTEKLPRFWDHFLARVEDPSFVLQNGTLGLFGKLDEPLERASLASRASGMLGLKVKVDSHLDGSELPSAEAITLIDRESLHERFRSLPIFFGVNRTSVQDSEMAKVKELAGLMKKSGLPLIISGFADRKGDPEYNRELGLKRAASVKRALEKLGVDTDGMEVESVVAEESGKEVRRVEVKAAQVKRA